MFTEGLGVQGNIEVLIEANEVAELGAIKPKNFGMLIRRKYFKETEQKLMREDFSDIPLSEAYIEMSGGECENPDFSLNYNETAKACSEYLCDFDVTPQIWNEAGVESRANMLKTTVRMMAGELKLPESWKDGINAVFVLDKEYDAASFCNVRDLDNGGVVIVDIPRLEINIKCLDGDFYDSNAAVYHEMIHMKMYSSVDTVNITSTTDIRFLDLIKEMKECKGTFSSSNINPYSSYERDVTAQSSYFKYILQTVVQRRFS